MLNINFSKKTSFKASRLLTLFIFLFLCFGTLKYSCFAASETATITLPQKIAGLQKLEYTINGTSMGSVAGKSQITVAYGSKINFLLKFESEGYDNLNAKSVKINSEKGACLSLNHYDYDQNSKIVMFAPTDSEKIDPDQTYVSSDYIVKNNDSLSISGIELNKYEIKINSDSNDTLSEAVTIVCADDKNNTLNVNYDDASNSFSIANVSFKSNLKLSVTPTEAYSQSEITLTSNDSAISYTQNGYTIYGIQSNINAQITGITKNKYTLNFKNYSNATFKTADETEKTLAGDTVVFYGDTFKFKCETQDEILNNSEITVNGVTIRSVNGIYTLKNITENANILITPKENAKYSINLMSGENRVSLADTSGNVISTGYAKLGTNFNFKLSPSQAYSRYILSSLTYAVPTAKLQDKSFNTSDPGNEFLITPSGAGIYNVNNITEPMTIIVNNLKINSYTVHIPENMLGATIKANVTDGVTKISEYAYSVEHDKSLVLTLEAKDGYNISNAILSTDSSAQVQQNGNEYIITNITRDTYVAASNINIKTYSVSFDSNGIECTGLQSSVFMDNIAQIEHKNGVLKFSVSPAENCTVSPEGIKLSVNGTAVLKQESDYYELTNVTSDTVIHVSGITCPQVTLSLSTQNDDLEITSPSGETISGQEQTVGYGEDFSFTITSKSGQNVENMTFSNAEDNEITVLENNLSSMTYSLLGASSDISLLADSGYIDAGYSSSTVSQIQLAKDFVLQQFGDNTFTSITPKQYTINTQDLSTSSDLIKNVFSSNDIPKDSIHWSAQTSSNIQELSNIKFFSDEKLTNEVKSNQHTSNSNNTLYNDSSLNSSSFPSGKSNNPYLTVSIPSSNITVPSTDIYFTLYYNFLEAHQSSNSDNLLQLVHSIGPSRTITAIPTEFLASSENNIGYIFNKLYCVRYGNQLPQNRSLTINNLENCSCKITNLANQDCEEYTDSTSATYNIPGSSEVITLEVEITCEDGYFFSSSENILKYVSTTDADNISKSDDSTISEDSKTLRCKFKISPFASGEKKLSVSGLEKEPQKTISFTNSNSHSRYFNAEGEEISSINFSYSQNSSNSKVIFYTKPKDGYKMLPETLNIKFDSSPTLYKYKTCLKNDNIFSDWIEGDPPNGITITTSLPKSDEIKYEITGLKNSVTISSEREQKNFNASFAYNEGVSFKRYNSSTNAEEDISSNNVNLNYSEDLAFTVNALSGYDISNCEVWVNRAGTNSLISMTNGKYVIYNITENVLITVKNVTKDNVTLSFGVYDGVTFQDELGNTLSQTMSVPYGDNFKFKIAFDERYSKYAKDKLSVKAISAEQDTPLSLTPDKNVYSLNKITDNVTIKLEGLSDNTYKINFTSENGIQFYKSTDLKTSISQSEVTHGENFSFVIQTSGERYNIDNIEVSAVSTDKPQSPVRILPSNGVYTIENITSDYTINVTGVSIISRKVELRTINGAAFVDESGNTMSNTVTVPDGSTLSFYVSLDVAYNKSTAVVSVKGSEDKLTPDSDGKYTKEINADTIIEITGIKKNTYTATFEYCEGLEYRTSRNKAFTGTQGIEYGESFYFRVSLLDAYDQSSPHVLLNGEKTLVENGGVYCIEEISDDVVITVENVEKNPEEVAMESIKDIPEVVNTASDVNAIIKATQTYNSLSDENKEKVTNTKNLESAQTQAGKYLHTSGGITVSNVDWYIKIVVTDLYHDADQLTAFSEEVERRSVLSLYKIELIDTLTGNEYTIPYGKTATFTMKAPDLTGYQNAVVAHLNSSDNMEYLDFNVINGEVTFTASSTNLFGIAAKGIPNYAENPSLLQISVAPLVESEEELQSLLGEGLVSQLGNLIEDDDDDASDTSSENSTGSSSQSSQNNSPQNNSSSNQSGSDATFLSAIKELGENVTEITEQSINKTFNWAKNNEFWSVIIVLVVGSGLIALIILLDKKKNNENK